MTSLNGQDSPDHGPRGTKRRSSPSRLPFVDTGWDDYDQGPTDASGVPTKRVSGTEDRRNYKSTRSGGPPSAPQRDAHRARIDREAAALILQDELDATAGLAQESASGPGQPAERGQE